MDGPGHPSLVQGADDVCRDDVTLAEQDAGVSPPLTWPPFSPSNERLTGRPVPGEQVTARHSVAAWATFRLRSNGAPTTSSTTC
jgi:hypothetical protein